MVCISAAVVVLYTITSGGEAVFSIGSPRKRFYVVATLIIFTKSHSMMVIYVQIAHYSSNDGYFWMTNRSTGQNVIENALFWHTRLNKLAKCNDSIVFDGLKNWNVH